MKPIVNIYILLVTMVTSIVAATASDNDCLSDWTSNPIIMQTVASSWGPDGCRIYVYNKPKGSIQSFGFALMPHTSVVPFQADEGKTFADIIRTKDTLYFCVENNTDFITESRATTVAAYSQLLARRFMLLCDHVERRDHIQRELEKNAHIFNNITEVKDFLHARLRDSSFVVFDVATYTTHMISQTVNSDMLKKEIASSRETTLPRIIAGRSMSF